MNKKEDLSWENMMQSTSDKNSTMKAPTLVGIVVALHVVAVSAFIFIQGCGTVQPRPTMTSTDAPPPPVMPPKADKPTGTAKTGFKPPVPVGTTPGDLLKEGSISHVIAKGETLSHVAKKYGVSTKELIALNNLANPNKVSIGQKLMVPAHGSLAKATSRKTTTTKKKTTKKKKNPATASGNVYVVQSGDVLSRIAVKFGTTVSALREANGLTGDKIVVGQELALPKGATKKAKKQRSMASTKKPPKKKDRPATTEASDTKPAESDKPAEKVETTVTETVTTTVTEETTVVPDPGPSDPDDKPIMYTVVQGDTIDEIAKLFIVSRQDIMKLNELDATAELKPGQKLKIPPSAL